ncbi:MAG: hypothetical protein HYU73_14005 [Betaproteobacteria bacterium]|nr:hypothetical protein [Betaproteobacteria bacterium]
MFYLLLQPLTDLIEQTIFLPVSVTAGLIVTATGVIALCFQLAQFALAIEFIR